MGKDQENLENHVDLVEKEVETKLTAEETEKDSKEEMIKEKTESKAAHYFNTILSGVLDQILAVALALILFLVFDLILGMLGYEMVMREEIFLIIFIISNVLYYPISQEVLNGKTVGKKVMKK